MSKSKKLEDAYRFAGFRPLSKIRGVFNDAFARVIVLSRREKKRHASLVVVFTRGFTIGKPDGFETFPAVAFASIWNWKSAEFPVRTAAW